MNSENKTKISSILITGPSGCGKSSFSKSIFQLCNEMKRKTILVNLDPYNPHNSEYQINLDELISLKDVMEDLKLG